MSDHHFWTCPECRNQYPSKDARDAHACEAGRPFTHYRAPGSAVPFCGADLLPGHAMTTAADAVTCPPCGEDMRNVGVTSTTPAPAMDSARAKRARAFLASQTRGTIRPTDAMVALILRDLPA